jgi:hypothetical protein
VTVSAYTSDPSCFYVEDMGPVIYNAAPAPIGTPTAWTALTLQNSWVNFGGGYQVGQYRMVGDIVYLRGVVCSGTAGQTIATLPAGYRPPLAQSILCQLGTPGATSYVIAGPAGTLTPPAGTANGFLDLSSVQFSITP